jgi:hypothetical protein
VHIDKQDPEVVDRRKNWDEMMNSQGYTSTKKTPTGTRRFG